MEETNSSAASASSGHADWVRVLVERHFDVRDGHLLVEGLDIRALAEQYGTPCYVYSERVLRSSWAALRAALPGGFDLAYSIKANPHPALLQFFLRQGAGLEVASDGEILAALAAGCPPKRLIFAGPGKTDDELRLAITEGLGEIHAESVGEIARTARLATQLGRRASIGLRVNPSLATAVGSLQMGGKPSQFGIDEEQLDNVLSQLKSWPAIELTGLHLNTGTQMLESDLLLAYYRHAATLGRRVAAQWGRPLQTLDLGGGLGIPYFEGQNELDLAAVRDGLTSLIAGRPYPEVFGAERCLLEPGRFLVGPAGIYVTRVIDCKQSRGQMFVIVDGGLHHHLPASGNFGQMLRRPFPLVALEKLNAQSWQAVNVVGPLCTPLDTLGRSVNLPPLDAGDLVGIVQSGAYARAASPLQFLGHRTPPEIWVHDGQSQLIRRRGDWEDFQRDIVATR